MVPLFSWAHQAPRAAVRPPGGRLVSLLAVEDLRRRSAGEVLPRGPAERTAVRTRLIPGDVLREPSCSSHCAGRRSLRGKEVGTGQEAATGHGRRRVYRSRVIGDGHAETVKVKVPSWNGYVISS